MKSLKLSAIKFDADTQMRDGLNGDTVADYRDAMKAGDEFPPLVVFFDGSEYWLGDGYHRWHAASEAGLSSFKCDIRQGSRRDAILWACGANGSHGLRRNNVDKHRAVKTLLLDAEWVTWSDHVIAEKCGVSHPFVGKLREQLVTVTSCSGSRKGKDGKSRKANRKLKPPTSNELATDELEYDVERGESVDSEEFDTSVSASVEQPSTQGSVINRFRPFWDGLTSQERVTLFVWINGQLN